jgi:hypothetical protein
MDNFENAGNGKLWYEGKALTWDEVFEALEQSSLETDEELRKYKEEILGGSSPAKEPKKVSTPPENSEVIGELQKALEASIRELRGAIDAIASVQYSIVGQCKQSKAKAVESHKEAQASLSDHNMTGVFLHSTNKTAHIKIVQILREQAGHAESKASSLRKSLANLEKLKTQFQTQAKLVNFQASNPSANSPVEKAMGSPPVDAELKDLQKQLESL